MSSYIITMWLLTTSFLSGATISFSGNQQSNTVRTYGLVIGTNVSRDPDVKPLRYADDDAIQNANLLSDLGATVVLLVSPDTESLIIFPGIQSSPPTRASVDGGLRKLNGLMEQARSEGLSPVLYIFYSGHGDIENNEGYVNLHDDKFWRSDFIKLLESSRADRNHVIVDACKSYFLVFNRGAGGNRSPVLATLINEEEALPSNTGVFLSTSAAIDSHEWEAFQGGVFSHEMRSALRGAADLNLDGKLTYEETSAFIWSANISIPNSRFRPRFFTRPPQDEDAKGAILLSLNADSADYLVIGPGTKDHIYVEDDRGLRLADMRSAAEQQVQLFLPSRRPLFVRHVDSNMEVELPKGERLHLAMLPLRRTTASRRGAEHMAFRRLFQRPFGAETLLAYQNQPPQIFDEQKPDTDWTRLMRGVAIGSIGIGILGGILTAMANNEHDNVTSLTVGVERRNINNRIDSLNTGAIVCYALAGTGIMTYLLWTFWPEAEVQVEIMPTNLSAAHLSVRF